MTGGIPLSSLVLLSDESSLPSFLFYDNTLIPSVNNRGKDYLESLAFFLQGHCVKLHCLKVDSINKGESVIYSNIELTLRMYGINLAYDSLDFYDDLN